MRLNKLLQEILNESLTISKSDMEKLHNDGEVKINGKTIKFKTDEITEEDLDVGHEDDEPRMLKQTAFEISEYALELYDMLSEYDEMEMEIDFPHWWQAKLVKARDYIGKAKHYLEFQTKQKNFD